MSFPSKATLSNNKSEQCARLDIPHTPTKKEEGYIEHLSRNSPEAATTPAPEMLTNENSSSLFFPAEANLENSKNQKNQNSLSHLKHQTPSKRKPRYRPANRIGTMNDPMIQTILGPNSTSSAVLPDYLSLSLTDESNSPIDMSDGSQNKQPKLYRRRSRNELVEAIVSKAVENLANRNRKSPRRDSLSQSEEKNLPTLKDKCALHLEGINNETLEISPPEVKRKSTKRNFIRKSRKRMSETGILGQIGCCSPGNPSNFYSPERSDTKNHVVGEFSTPETGSIRSPSFSTSQDGKDSEENREEETHDSSVFFASQSSHFSSFSDQNSFSRDKESFSHNQVRGEILDSSYEDQDQSNIESSDGEESVAIVPERLWNGSVLHPDGQLTSTGDIDENESNAYSVAMCKSLCTEHEVSDFEEIDTSFESNATQYVNSKKLDESEKEMHQKSFANFENESCSEGSVEVAQICQSRLEKFDSESSMEGSCFLVATEVKESDVDQNDSYSSSNEYSTDTDHDSDEEIAKTKHVPLNNPPATVSTISSSSTTRSKIVLSTEKVPERKADFKLTLPRFKIDPMSSPERKSESCSRKTSPSKSSSSTTAGVTTISKHELVKPKKWSLGSQIGAGSFGVVHVGMNDLTGNLMAVKILHNIVPDNNNQINTGVIKDLQREIDLMGSLYHPNIVRYFGAERKETTLYIFQEWVPGGSVSSLLRKFGSFTVAVIRRYLFQILQGLKYLHSNHILHRDIKGGNILVDDRGTIKLADFGASKQIFPASSLAGSNSIMMQSMTIKGTPYFMAPEVFEQKYNKKADIWSVGGVILQMMSGQPPWKTLGFQSPMSLFYHLKSTDGPPPVDFVVQSASLRKIVEKCFEREADKRPGAQELLNEEFFKEDDDECDEELLSVSVTNKKLHESLDDSISKVVQKRSLSGKGTSCLKSAGDISEIQKYSSAMKDVTNREHNIQRPETKVESKLNHFQQGKKFERSIARENLLSSSHSRLRLRKKLPKKTSKSKGNQESNVDNYHTSNVVSDDWPSWAKKQVKTDLHTNNQDPMEKDDHSNMIISPSRTTNPFRSQMRNKDLQAVESSVSKLSISENKYC